MLFENLVKEKIYFIIKSYVEESESIDLNARFEDIGIGSISLIKIMVEIEEYYDIEIEEKYFTDEDCGNVDVFINKMSEYVSAIKPQ